MPKSTRAIKVTDKDKAWNRKAQPSKYRIETIPQNKTFLITCEGQTEELYIKSFPVLGARVKVINLQGQSKLKLVETTTELLCNFPEKYDEVWCVFDMDVKRGEDEFADFDNAIDKAIQNGYKVAYSNDAFELWFYLHYNHSETQELRTFYYEELGNKFNINYIRDGKKYDFCQKIYTLLEKDALACQKKAIQRAKKLFDIQQHLPYHQRNPVTLVYELVMELNNNLRR
ncbi:RloB-like protein [Chitinophaga dinghuensis]|uniref:RloB-like protein n=1 Tax=Chitinophaga dinghuensis TaxID=1539050 RepID=A0A327VT02_9BACT|nr:RloB family protein [Chitinophaga dinghuensis]RAJ73723.1 RloB-like protein [Chitinophaga dinghuensis]